jgi:hypothetical protein
MTPSRSGCWIASLLRMPVLCPCEAENFVLRGSKTTLVKIGADDGVGRFERRGPGEPPERYGVNGESSKGDPL